eukprot:4687782-Alexandrium_andersonii.AAC.1
MRLRARRTQASARRAFALPQAQRQRGTMARRAGTPRRRARLRRQRGGRCSARTSPRSASERL